MANISKNDIKECVKKSLEEKHIPDEASIRRIIREEIDIYYKKEEAEQQKPFTVRFNEYFRNKKYKNIGWYILMFILTLIDVIGFKWLTDGSHTLMDVLMKTIDMATGRTILLSVTLLAILIVLSILVVYTMKVYDKMVKINYKYAKLICLCEIIYWCNLFFPSIGSWIEKIL